MALRRLVYTSKATEKFTQRSLLDILHDSRAFNSLDEITGVLMHRNGTFLQVLEGSPEKIDELFTRLNKDPRHSGVTMLRDTTTDKRLFSNWAMGCADFDDPELSLIPGIRTDLTDPDVVTEMLEKLPELAGYLMETIQD